MGRPRAKFNARTMRKWIAEGRGQGHGQDYLSWLKVQNVPSQGYVHRIMGWKTKRRHEFMSNNEAGYFHLLEWSPFVTDVREQFPLLPLDETIAIAKDHGIKHPTDPRTRYPIVMTTDFLVDVQRNGSTVQYARTVKPAKDLCSERVLEKFEIERRYWVRRGVDWAVVSDCDLPVELIKNIQWVHQYRDVDGKLSIGSTDVEKAERIMAELIRQGVPPAKSASTCDDRLGLAPGTGLALVRHFLATRRWSVDMSKLINPQKPIALSA